MHPGALRLPQTPVLETRAALCLVDPSFALFSEGIASWGLWGVPPGNPQAVGLGLNSCLRDGQIQMPSLHIFPYMVRVIEARILRWELIPGHLWALNAITGVPGGGGGALAYTEEQRHETGQREGGRCWP